jgi:putative glutamine amidotransferase
MSDTRPVIGIGTLFTEASWAVWTQDTALLPFIYISAVQRAGGLALMLPPDPETTEDPDQTLELVDGLMLAGGADIHPKYYGAQAHPETKALVPQRDAFELALTNRAIELDMPVLGICRGMQLINIALGGTLLQHVPETFGHTDHRRSPGSFDNADHDVRLQDESLAATAAGERLHGTKSHHHQGVDRIGDGLIATGLSTLDDLTEAIEAPDKRFVLGVQWHPEADERSQVIGALVRAAEDYRTVRGSV